jgi:formiminoglutamase
MHSRTSSPPAQPASSNSPWSGRHDGDGPEHRRWHQAAAGISDTDEAKTAGHADLSLLGFRSDEGVRRNQGRTGARHAPEAIRRALAPLALHTDLTIHDAGDVDVKGRALEAGQETLGQKIAGLLTPGRLVMVLGGGHETAYASYLGLARSGLLEGKRLGILNLDAHFDLRQDAQPSSGTPFLQIAEAETAAGRPFRYAVAGISEPNNTDALFATAHRLGVECLTDEQCQDAAEVTGFVARFIDSVDLLYLTVDLDVLPASTAPGVSAPAAFGVPFPVIAGACRQAAASGKLALVDVVELNPEFDEDGATARCAARLLTTIAHSV